jgi:uncharacterized protein (TIGR02646 family)
MRNDPCHQGQETYKRCRSQLFEDQHGLCAYCERILERDPGKFEVEHFVSKSHSNKNHNWDLDWANLLAVCHGNEEEKGLKNIYQKSCGNFKNIYEIKKIGVIDYQKLVNPTSLPCFPNLYTIDTSNFFIKADKNACISANISYDNLNYTINIFNLNCDSLTEKRKIIYAFIAKKLKNVNNKPKNEQYKLFIKKLIESFFGPLEQQIWPAFFTAIRCAFGNLAEKYLNSINYDG